MKIEELKIIIEECVRKVIKEELSNKGILAETKKSPISPINKIIPKEKLLGLSGLPINKIKLKTGNVLLDNVLAETTGGIPQQDGSSVMQMLPMQSMLNESNESEIKENAPEVYKAMTRDYSSMLKKMEQIKPSKK